MRQQDGSLALDLRAVLQILDAFHALGEPRLETGERFARQWRTGLGSIALPRHGIGDVELGLRQQQFGFLTPLGGNDFLALGTLLLVELLAQQAGGALVACAQFLEHFLHLLGGRIAGDPVANTRSALTRSGRCKGAAG